MRVDRVLKIKKERRFLAAPFLLRLCHCERKLRSNLPVRCRDCFVTLQAPRNDIKVFTPEYTSQLTAQGIPMEAHLPIRSRVNRDLIFLRTP